MMDESEVVSVKILFFAKARELSSVKESKLTIPKEITYDNLRDKIVSEFNLGSIRENLILALNEDFVAENVKLNLSEKDEIAVIPPLSGGSYSFLYFLKQNLTLLMILGVIISFFFERKIILSCKGFPSS